VKTQRVARRPGATPGHRARNSLASGGQREAGLMDNPSTRYSKQLPASQLITHRRARRRTRTAALDTALTRWFSRLDNAELHRALQSHPSRERKPV
jgi:hypothetical protein